MQHLLTIALQPSICFERPSSCQPFSLIRVNGTVTPSDKTISLYIHDTVASAGLHWPAIHGRGVLLVLAVLSRSPVGRRMLRLVLSPYCPHVSTLVTTVPRDAHFASCRHTHEAPLQQPTKHTFSLFFCQVTLCPADAAVLRLHIAHCWLLQATCSGASAQSGASERYEPNSSCLSCR